MTEIRFGFWPKKWTLDAGTIHIEPLCDFDAVVEATSSHECAGKRWFYPPLSTVDEPGLEPEKRPTAPVKQYALRPTHFLRVEEADDREFAELLVAFLGVLEGMRLTPDGWTHFYKTPLEPHVLTDLVVDRGEIAVVLTTAHAFWRAHPTTDIRRGLFGAAHWLLFSQLYEHDFERFAGQYIVLDTCFRLHCDMNGRDTRSVSHAARPAFLAQSYRIPEPPWAKLRPDKACDLSELRNQFFHEGRYGGEPIGFAHPKDHPSLVLQLTAFNTRLLLGILGLDCGYVRSAVDTREMHELELARTT